MVSLLTTSVETFIVFVGLLASDEKPTSGMVIFTGTGFITVSSSVVDVDVVPKVKFIREWGTGKGTEVAGVIWTNFGLRCRGSEIEFHLLCSAFSKLKWILNRG